jgi:hypothetical protein
VVRVRAAKAIHLLTKKGIQPVYVRNEDEARPADAVQLRRLIDREREAPTRAETMSKQVEQLRKSLIINSDYQSSDSDTWFLSQRYESQTFLKLVLLADEPVTFDMDALHEAGFLKIIRSLYPRVYDTAQRDVANQAEDRGADFYEYIWYHKSLKHEMKWRVTADCAVAHATQVKFQQDNAPEWSAVDLAVHTLRFVTLAVQWWRAIGYFGQGKLHSRISVPGLQLSRSKSTGVLLSGFWHRVNQNAQDARISSGAVVDPPRPRSSAEADVKMNYFTGTADLPALVTSLLNQLLRSMGYAVRTGELQDNVRSLL